MSDALRPHRGVLILVFGILGIVGTCIVFGIVAWVMGRNDLKEIDAGKMDPTGRGMTQAGMVLGIISTCLGALALIAAILFFMGMLTLFGAAAAGAAGG